MISAYEEIRLKKDIEIEAFIQKILFYRFRCGYNKNQSNGKKREHRYKLFNLIRFFVQLHS